MKQEIGPGIKVLYLDHWTLGLHNFTMYDALLKARGCTTKLFHIGSYRAEAYPSEKEPYRVKDGIECSDVTYYKTKNLGRVLDREKPDVIVALNHAELFERSLFKAAHNRGIPCVYIMHGIRLEDLSGYEQFYGANTGVSRRLKKIPKYYDLMRMFAAAHLEADPLFLFKKDLYRLGWRFVTSPIREIFQPQTKPDTQPDLFLLYSDFDRRIHHEGLGLSKDKLHIIGNTKLDSLFTRVDEFSTDEYRLKLYQSLSLDPNQKYVLNIEDAMVEMNPKSFPHERQAEWYRYMEKAINQAGYRFVVKVHPGTDLARFKTIFDKNSTTNVVQSGDLDGLIYNSAAVIGTISTALINAVALEKIVLACEWLNVDMLKSPTFTVKYGGGISCLTEQAFEQCLRDLDCCEQRLAVTRTEMLDMFINYRDGRSSERVADAITAIAHQYQALRTQAVA
ncbi:MAG: hypothetical protein V4568_05205 [Pseudomonadota bacterium]